MSRRAAALNRAIVFVIGLALIGVGAYAAAWYLRVPFVRDLVARYDRVRVESAPLQGWWQWALAGTLVVALVFGLALAVVDLTRRRTSAVTVTDPATGAVTTVDPGALADGLAAQLAQFPGVHRVRARAVLERGLPTMLVTVSADAALDTVAFTASAEALARGAARALGGARVATQVLLHVDPAAQTEHGQTERAHVPPEVPGAARAS
ncbi:alkaline shock response membrane anchor protein AmaP [Rhodococcus sp. HNM0569]|uniref:alkaline shock response membrane anchor protein AmaP n=1 Tax=Rhodococcus sp. HNM0569 TaxID=2716340 RepID=UPI001F10C685|nr:alkaline shock response membrane anchor protein AmaP [Rhodococcus sp. HNM0569]